MGKHESFQNPSDFVRDLIGSQGIKVGQKETPESELPTFVTVKSPSIGRPEGSVNGRILEINYDDPEPYLVMTVHGYKAHQKVLLKDVTNIEKFSDE